MIDEELARPEGDSATDYIIRKNTIIKQRLQHCFHEYHGKTAIEWNTRSISFDELAHFAQRINCRLREKPISQDAIIGICLENPVQLAACIIGAILNGNTFSIFDPLWPGDQLKEAIEIIDPLIMIENQEFSFFNDPPRELDDSFFQITTVSTGENESKNEQQDNQSPLFVHTNVDYNQKIFWAGVNQADFATSLDWEIKTFGINQDSRINGITPIHRGGFTRVLLVSLLAGATLCIPPFPEPNENIELLEWVEQKRINVFYWQQQGFHEINENTLSHFEFKHLKWVVLTGMGLEPSDLGKWYRVFAERIPVALLYGPADTTMVSTYYFPGITDSRRLAIPLGNALDGAGAFVLDEELEPCDEEFAGEIYLRSAFRFFKTRSKQEKENSGFIHDPFDGGTDALLFRTGLLGRLREDGSIDIIGPAHFRGEKPGRQPVSKPLPIPTVSSLPVKTQTFSPLEPAEQREYYPLSSAQKRLYILQEIDQSSTAYNMPAAIPLGEQPDIERLKQGIHDLFKRHESLRTSFIKIEDEPVQRVQEEVEFALEISGWSGEESFSSHYFVRPFNLEQAPLLRAGLVEVPGKGFILWMDIHHIISDGTSQGIMFADFFSLYRQKNLPALEIQYKDFSQWQNQAFINGEMARQESFWLDIFLDAAALPRLELPTDFPRPEVFTYTGSVESFSLKGKEAAAFKQLAGQYGGTLYMAFLAVVNVLFYKYTGQTDIIIGTGVAGRRHDDLKNIIGMFVNTLAMRNFPCGDQDFVSFLKTVIARSIEAFENQDFQFELLVDKLKLERDISRNPLFDVCMVVQNFNTMPAGVKEGATRPTGTDWNLEVNENEGKTSKFDMTFFIGEEDGNIDVNIEFYTGIFNTETIQRLISHLEAIIITVCRQPRLTLNEIDIISPQEKSRLLFSFNDTTNEYPYEETVPGLFRKRAGLSPDFIALEFNDQAMTYRQLDNESDWLAGYLAHDKNLQREEPVGVWLSPGWQRPMALLGILKAGGAFVPLDPAMPVERVKAVIMDAHIRILVSGKEFIRELNRLQWECQCLDDFLCLDSYDIDNESERQQNELMDEELWRHVGDTAADDIMGGGWLSSYTGLPLSRQEMDEYGDNVLKKLSPLLHKQMRVLEIGCASGITMYRIAPRVQFYYGTDLSTVIIQQNRDIIANLGIKNIKLAALPAHQVHEIEENGFDLVIINSVIQCFHGHNYLRQVLRQALDLMNTNGYLFIGDVMDLEKKSELVKELTAFKYALENRDKGYKTKTDFSAELFMARAFWQDLEAEWPGIARVEISEKFHTIPNELTRFRYDVLLHIAPKREQKEGEAVLSCTGKMAKKHRNDLRSLRQAVEKFDKEDLIPVDKHGLAYIIYTSGTTGRPKGVAVEHRALVNLCSWHNRYFAITHQDRAFQYAGFGFDAAVWELFPYLVKGAAVHILPGHLRLEIEQLSRTCERLGLTVGFLPTQFCEQFLEVENQSLRLLLTGGDKLRSFKSQRYQLYNNYGPTENTVVTTSFRVERYWHNIPIGKPVDNNQVYIFNRESLQLQPIGVAGEIYIGGDSLARGYLNNPVLTNQKFLLAQGSHLVRDGVGNGGQPVKAMIQPVKTPGEPLKVLYRTGDLARWLDSGDIEFFGRIDQQVKIRGFRIETAEVESRLLKHPLVKDAVVTARFDDAVTGGVLCAYIVADEMLNPGELADFLSHYLPAYMIPAYFTRLERLPLLPSGKVDRKALPAPDIESNKVYAAAQTELEKKLVETWAEILNLDPALLGIDDNFFDLGGHSLKATILVSRIHKEMDIKIPLAEVFNHQTIRELAGFISRQHQGMGGKYSGIFPVEKREYYALSSAQKRMYFLQDMEATSTSYNIPLVFPLESDIKVEKLEKVFKQLIARHESLRTSFIRVNNEPVQRVFDEIPWFSLQYSIVETTAAKLPVVIQPFDLSCAPLLRVHVFELPGKQRFCLVDMHHIISDGTSHAILVEDFLAYYNGRERETLTLQYKDFSGWQNQLFEKGEIKAQEDYWLALFADANEIPRLNLPLDNKRPDVFTFAGNTYAMVLEGEEAIPFKDLGIKHGGTLYMNLLALFNTLFYKYTRQNDIIIGSGIAGRPHVDLQRIIGMFINMLAMRNSPTGKKKYQEFLDEVIARSIEAFDNQEVQFEELVDMLNVERDPSRNPLFDVSMVVQNFRDIDTPGSDQPIRVQEGSHGETSFNPTAKFDLTFSIQEAGDTVGVAIEYYTAIFKVETIARISRHIRQLVRIVGLNPGLSLDEIEIISSEEKEDLLFGFNNTTRDFGTKATIQELFHEQVQRTPDHVALVQQDEIMTYQELDRRANQLALYLGLEKGVRPGIGVGILLSPCLLRVVAILGTLKAGGMYIPMDPALPHERIRFMIDDAAINLMISGKKFIGELNRLQWECPDLDHFLCLDSYNLDNESEREENRLMDDELWEHVGETAEDEIMGGGWVSSYTGLPLTAEEMAEYGDNVLKKLRPLLHPGMNVLEIGCASGITMFRIAPWVNHYYGTDLSAAIIKKNQQRIQSKGFKNITLAHLAAHEITQLEGQYFDLIIINSVIQCFHGYHYLRRVLRQSILRLGENDSPGYLFIGDVMDLEKKSALIKDLESFKYAPENRGKGYTTKTDLSAELFVAPPFWEDFAAERHDILDIALSPKLHTIKNELTKFRYDVLLTIDRAAKAKKPMTGATNQEIRPVNRAVTQDNGKWKKQKYRDDCRALEKYSQQPCVLTHSLDPGYSSTPAYVIYTSGSTGRPKGVIIEQVSLVNAVKWHRDYYSMGPRDQGTMYASFAFDASVLETFPYLIGGSAIHILDDENKADVEWLNHYYEKRHITIAFLPTQVAEMFMANQDNHSLRLLWTGGDRLRIFHPRNYQLYNNYGPTENTVVATVYPVDKEEHHIPIGKPMDNTRVFILNPDTLQIQPIGVTGELCIAGTGLARGYLNNPALTAEKFITLQQTTILNQYQPGIPNCVLYRSGDLARWLVNGNIEFFGRIDRQVKIRGYRIETGEIETCLLAHNEVKDAVVIDYHENGETTLCAYVVCQEPNPAPDLNQYLAQHLPAYMIPAHLVQLTEIPLGNSGKIDRKRLPLPGNKKTDSVTPPRNPLEKTLAEIWANVLNITPTQVSLDDNFFQSGGHSLKATILTAKIHETFKVKIPLGVIFKTPTIRAIADFIRSTRPGVYQGIEPVEKREYYPCSPGQKRLFLIQQMDPGNIVYHMPQVMPLAGDIHKQHLEKIFQDLLARHESFRTSFTIVQETPVQRVHDHVDFNIETFLAGPGQSSLPLIRQAVLRSFDLSRAPLLRAVLVEIPAQGHFLVTDMHHIISDGVSMTILEKEFRMLYQGSPLPPLLLDYKDYSLWLHEPGFQSMVQVQETYWLTQLKEDNRTGLPVLQLPVDYARPQVQQFAGSTVAFNLHENLALALEQIATRTNATLYMVLMAIFNIWLAKLSGNMDETGVDIIVGTPTAGRSHADLQDIVGMFVNTLPIKNRPDGHLPFSDFLAVVRQKTLAAYENQDYPFEELVEKLAPERHAARNPIFDVTFNLLNQLNYHGDIPIQNKTISTNNPETYEHIPGVAKFDLTLTTIQTRPGLLFTLEYSNSLFKPATIERMIGYFKNICREIARDEHIKISHIDFISEAEKQQVLFAFNPLENLYPITQTMPELFETSVQKNPDTIALAGYSRWTGNQPGKRQCLLTYRELDREASRLTTALLQKGAGPGHIIAIIAQPSIHMISAILAILKSGAAYLPIDPQAPLQRIHYILADSQAQLVVAHAFNPDHLNGIPCTVVQWPNNENQAIQTPQPLFPTMNDLAYVIYTSGTTGKPKGVAVNHGNICPLFHWSRQHLAITPGQRTIQIMSYYFDFSVWEIFNTLMNGATLFPMPREWILNPVPFFEVLRLADISIMNVTPTQLRYYLDYALETRIKLDRLRQVILGGETFNFELDNLCLSVLAPHCRLINIYAPTETTIFSTVCQLQPGARTALAKDAINSIPIGRPIANTMILILDRFLKPCPIRVAGELFIGGNGVSRGYLNNPGLTNEKFVFLSGLNFIDQPFTHPFLHSLFFKTGDWTRWLADGNIEFIGRIDQQVKIRGLRIELGEIQSQLSRHPGVKEAVVIAKTNDTNENYLCAYFVPRDIPDTGSPSPNQLKEFLAGVLPNYMIPAYFLAIPQIPITNNGKLNRQALPNPPIQPSPTYIPPTNDNERKLQAIWSELLQTEPGKISMDASFFDLGGHSLKATVLIARIHQAFNCKLNLVDIFTAPTIHRLAKKLDQSHENKYIAIDPVEDKEYYHLSPAQKRIFFIQQIDPNSIAYNMPQLLPLGAVPAIETLESVTRLLIQRHESFRTSFHLLNDQPVQRIHEKSLPFKVGLQFIPKTQENIFNHLVRPFDLTCAPLLRVEVAQVGQEYILLTDMHHIISDGVSMTILTQEIRLLLNGETPGELKLQYRDYADWLNSETQTTAVKNQALYWEHLFSGQIPVLSLPLDFPRPAIQSLHGSRQLFSLTHQELEPIKTATANEDVTLFMILLALFNVLLGKLSGQEDIIIGIPIAVRPHADLQNIIGMFVNTLALRNQAPRNLTFIQFLRHLRQNTITAFDNQEFPFETLVERVKVKRDPSRNPIFDVMLAFRSQVEEISPYAPPPLARTLTPDIQEQGLDIAKFDITLNILETTNGLSGEWEYSTALFKKETISRFIQYFLRLLQALCQQPHSPIGDLEIILDEEKKLILEVFNQTSVPYPQDKTIINLLLDQVEKRPDCLAVCAPHLPGESQQITYQELMNQTLGLAALLVEHGAKPGMILPLMVERSVDMVIAVLAIMKTGAAYLPVVADLPPQRVRFILYDCQAPLILTTAPLARQGSANNGWLNGLDIPVIPIDDPMIFSHTQPFSLPQTARPQPSDVAYVIYTSGSTGRPKGVMVEHRAFFNLILWKIHYYQVTSRDHGTQYASFGFDASVPEIFMYLTTGAALFIVPAPIKLDMPALNAFYERHDITASFLPTPICEAFMAYDNRSLRILLTGGDKLRLFVPRRYRLYNNYGPTEAAVAVSACLVERNDANIPIGQPIFNIQLFIFSLMENIPLMPRLQPVGIAGELCIGGHGLARGYMNNPGLTLEKFIYCNWNPSRLYRTGDLARWLANGLIEFLGRVDHQIKIRGNRIEPGEIESRLKEHPQVKETLVMMREDPSREPVLCAYIVPVNIEPTIEPYPLPDFHSWLSSYLPAYMIPLYFIPLQQIPLTSHGKLDRNALPVPSFPPSAEYVAPRTPLEKQLCAAWASILKRDENHISVKTDFFDCGGDSIKVVSVVAAINKKCGCQLPVTEFFKHPTIEQLAAFMETQSEKYLATPLKTPFETGEEEDALKVALKSKINEMKHEYYHRPLVQEIDRATQKRIKAFKKEFETYQKRVKKEKFGDLNRNRDYQHILVTGGTGFLGSYLARELLTQTPATLYLLIRGKSREEAIKRVQEKWAFYFGPRFYQSFSHRLQVVPADIGVENFGLGVQQWQEWSNLIDAVVNSAADTRHFGEYSDFYNINVRAVERLLQFCLAGKPKDFHHMSTISVGNGPIYIEGTDRFIFTEYCLDNRQSSDNVYTATKIEAERMVFAYRQRGVRASVYRLGNLVSDSETGKAQENIVNNWFFSRVKTYIAMGVIPVEIGDGLDMTFIDLVSRAIVLLLTRDSLINQVYHLSNPHPFGPGKLAEFLQTLGLRIATMDSIGFFEHLLENVTHPVLGNLARGFVLHSYILDVPSQRTLGMYFSDRTQRLLRELGFLWPAVEEKNIRAMLDHIRSIGFLPPLEKKS